MDGLFWQIKAIQSDFSKSIIKVRLRILIITTMNSSFLLLVSSCLSNTILQKKLDNFIKIELKTECWESSLVVTGLEHALVGRVLQYKDQVGYVLVMVAVGRGHLTWILGSQHSCPARKDLHSLGSYSLRMG